jgi:DUF1365 family protein
MIFDIVSDDITQVQHKTFAPFEHYVTYSTFSLTGVDNNDKFPSNLDLSHHRCKYEKPINWLLRLFSPTEMADICQFFLKKEK